MDTEQIDFVVSGSSARLLSREIHSSLRGRAVATVVSPFCFREYLRHRGEEPESSARRFTAPERSAAEKRLREFLVVGGFPEAQGLDEATRIVLLQGYVDTVLFRDVVERYGVTQVAALRWITRHALRSPCSSFSVNRLYNDLRSQGHAIGKAAVHDLLGHLIDAFLLAAAPVATESERRRNTNPRKLYPVDPGLIQAFDSGGRSNAGHALELVVFHELRRRGADVAYVKTKDNLEVDFLARYPGGREELIQVCVDPSEPATLGRELAALDAAGIEHPRAVRQLIVMEASTAGRIRHARTEPVAALQWLLSS